MFVPFEIILIFVAILVGARVLFKTFLPLFGKRWEDKQLEDAKTKRDRAQKLLRAAELEAEALEAEAA